jgi:protein-S-isoprenylcysteine O-methyltransferase Ste14
VCELTEPNDRAAVRVFPPAVPLIVILLGILLNRLWPIRTGFERQVPERYWFGGLIVAVAILTLGFWSVMLFKRSGEDPNPWKPSSRLVDRGPYRFTRNPMYLQMLLVCIGFAVLLANVWILLLTPVAAFVLQRYAILPEERYLEAKFGEEYLAYKRRVRRWI